ncbi:MAG: ComEA family DNA-binding protein [Actinobacteria bacterium]|nr:ComEA family DNA-binding protein [Actinomycetota bacterium]
MATNEPSSREPPNADSGAGPSHLDIRAALRARARDTMRFHRREAIALGVLALLILGGAGIAYVRAQPAPAASLAPLSSPTESGGAATGQVVVYIVGAVVHPGVYTFDPGARVLDALRAAGGFAKDADRFATNLARALVDGEQIVIPRVGEAAAAAAGGGGGSAGGGSAAGGKVNINSATVSDFDSLPGIGPVLAQRIFDYRTQHGPFHDIRDLMKVSGIGQRKFDSIKDFVTV